MEVANASKTVVRIYQTTQCQSQKTVISMCSALRTTYLLYILLIKPYVLHTITELLLSFINPAVCRTLQENYARVHWSVDLWFDFWQGQEACLQSSQSGSGTHPTSYSVGNWGFSPGGKSAGLWCGPLIPSNAEVKTEWSYSFTPQYAFMACTRRLNVFIDVVVSSNFCWDNIAAYVTVQSLKLLFCLLLIHLIRKASNRSSQCSLCFISFRNFFVIGSFLISYWSSCKVGLCYNIAYQN
jgi:hypothetical protein